GTREFEAMKSLPHERPYANELTGPVLCAPMSSLAYGRSCGRDFIASNSRVPPGGPKTPTRPKTRSGAPTEFGRGLMRPQQVLPEKKPRLRRSAMADFRL